MDKLHELHLHVIAEQGKQQQQQQHKSDLKNGQIQTCDKSNKQHNHKISLHVVPI